MFLTKHRIEWNWRNVELKLPPRLKVLKGHDDHVVSIYVFFKRCSCERYNVIHVPQK